MLLRPLRRGDPVRTPAGRLGRVRERADRNDRVLVRYPGAEVEGEPEEELIEESLLVFLGRAEE